FLRRVALRAEVVAAASDVARVDQVQEEREVLRGVEGAIVREAEVLRLRRLEDEGGAWRDLVALHLIVVVGAQCTDDLEPVAEPSRVLYVATDFRDVVDVFVAPVDRVAGARVREDVVDPVDERVLRAEVAHVLDLRREHARLVDDGLAAAEQERAIGGKAVLVAGVAEVQEHLREEPIPAEALLQALIRPVLDLASAVRGGQVDPADPLRITVGRDGFHVVARTKIDTSLACVTRDVSHAGSPDSGVPAAPGPE